MTENEAPEVGKLSPLEKSRRRARNTLLVTTPIYLLCLVPWYALRLITLRGMDELLRVPLSYWLIYWAMLAFPVVAALGTFFGWLLFYFQRFSAAFYLAVVPLVNLGLILVTILLFTFAIGL